MADGPATTRAAPVIAALFAASRRMELRLAGDPTDLPPRPSPLTLKADVWASVLDSLGLGERYADVVRGLRDGFDFEIPRITDTAVASNAPSTRTHQNALRDIVLKERKRGAYIGPFSNAADVQAVLHNPFQSMPLSLIPKPPDKFRLIQNFSATQPFLRRGAKWWVGAEGRRYDESYEYPLRAVTNAGREDGWHYGDDEIESLADELGLPLHKPTPWSSTFSYAGYLFSIFDRRAGLPAVKVATYRADIDAWLSQSVHRLEDSQRLLGRLLHASPVVLDAPRHLTRLIGFVNIAVRSNAHPRAQRHGSAALDKDIEWWREHLCGEEVWRSISQYAPKDINLFVDASSDWGVGIWWDGHSASYRLHPDWRSRGDGRDIQFAEALAIEVGLLHVLSTGFRSAALVVYTDNTGVQFGVPRGRMRNAAATSVIDRIHALQVDRDVVIHTRRVASADNPADGPSRGIRKEPGLPTIVLPALVAAEFLPHWQSPAGRR
ncbi:unnamed protein product [Tilletia laevis]|nr:unnamed protein product [Tilletia laevis]